MRELGGSGYRITEYIDQEAAERLAIVRLVDWNRPILRSFRVGPCRLPRLVT